VCKSIAGIEHGSDVAREMIRVLSVLFASIVFSSAAATLALGASCASKASKDIIIALDVGHNARRPGQQCQRFVKCPWGATSARGIPEYDFNLGLARHIKERLEAAGFQSTSLMITRTEGSRGLLERANRANRMKADIFLSIHHDGARDRYVKPWRYDGEVHYYLDEPSGFSLHVSSRHAESLSLARILADQLVARELHFTTFHEVANPAGARVPYMDSTRGIYRRDRLAVLNFTKMPGLLLEAGFIINRDEELVLSSPSHQEKIASAIVEAVGIFCAPSRPAGTAR
jgi:N-acetylmuramoyl-L-alanine amidase